MYQLKYLYLLLYVPLFATVCPTMSLLCPPPKKVHFWNTDQNTNIVFAICIWHTLVLFVGCPSYKKNNQQPPHLTHSWFLLVCIVVFHSGYLRVAYVYHLNKSELSTQFYVSVNKHICFFQAYSNVTSVNATCQQGYTLHVLCPTNRFGVYHYS